MRRACILLLTSAVLLSGCGKSGEIRFTETVAPRSSYIEEKKAINNELFPLNISVPDGWAAENDAQYFAIKANFSEEQKQFIDAEEYGKVSLIPDYTLTNTDNGDTITVFYYNRQVEEFREMDGEDFRSRYLSYYWDRDQIIRSGKLTRKQRTYDTANNYAGEANFRALASEDVVIDGMTFVTANVDAPYRGKECYEYAAFATGEDYVVCIVASTESGTSAAEFWELWEE